MMEQLDMIISIRNHLNKWLKDRREIGAKLTFNEDGVKPKTNATEDDSIEDGVGEEEEDSKTARERI